MRTPKPTNSGTKVSMSTRTRGKLTEAKIAKLNEVGLYGDGDGRYLQISNISGAFTKSGSSATPVL
jgi:hypothetical protein